jgi:hypothetical protein
MVNRVRVIDIPVANGRINASFIHYNPITLFMIFSVMDYVSLTTRLDPMALGYKALTSPDLPIPCPRY